MEKRETDKESKRFLLRERRGGRISKEGNAEKAEEKGLRLRKRQPAEEDKKPEEKAARRTTKGRNSNGAAGEWFR